MRLLNVLMMKLEEYSGSQIPAYDILSHCWGTEEVAFGDINRSTWREKRGASKIINASLQCQKGRNHHIWIDTCCIDKSSSAELSEAINSMYNWYAQSAVCYAYLEDIDKDVEDVEDETGKSRWFTRGWTLQELIAPQKVIFFDKNWNYLGDKETLSTLLSKITTIPEGVLADPSQHRFCSLARKMSWAAHRETTRAEDIAYCLLGLFEVSMPLLYGEGARAYIRLQEEIIKETDDQSLFAWGMRKPVAPDKLEPRGQLFPSASVVGVFATHPTDFAGSANVVPFPSKPDRLAYSMTNRGLRIELPILNPSPQSYGQVALLDCHYENDFSGVIGITLK
ncbi:heterokaryon incompatibility protein-domain-containing protein, partial [Rhexocercosporidium sp. MPI-PUGE-AT-0058]